MTNEKVQMFIGWGVHPFKDEIVDCGRYHSIDAARLAVTGAGFDVAEIETVYVSSVKSASYIIQRNSVAFLQGEVGRSDIHRVNMWSVERDTAYRYANRPLLEEIAVNYAHDHPGDLFQVLDAETMSVKFSVRWNN